MSFAVTIIADSVSNAGIRLTTMRLRYPRFIHAEFMTHRVFCRNASSSRAIPITRQIDDIIRDTAMPLHWGKNQAGMQAHDECDAQVNLDTFPGACSREQAWRFARDQAIATAKAFNQAGYHKQIVNRLLEPFAHITVVVTATEWDNFYELRCHPDAQPEMRHLAEMMRDAHNASVAKEVEPFDWHLPFITDGDREKHDITTLVKASVARCARVSYLTHDGGEPDIEKDVELYTKLVGARPIHASPAEHQARADIGRVWRPKDHGPLRGWLQLRKMIEQGKGVEP